MSRFRYYALITIALIVVPLRATGESYSAYKFEVLQGLAQSSDTVVSAKINSVALGERGDIYKDTTDTRVECLVTSVYIGSKALKGRSITVVFGAADEPISESSASPLLLLLKKEGENYRLTFFHRYGVFLVKDGVVQCAFEPKKKGLLWSYYSLQEIISRIKHYAKADVAMKTEIDDNISLDTGSLTVTFEFKNIGRQPVLLLPPTYCFSSLGVKKIPADRSEAEKTSWWSVDHWSFIKEPEPLLTLEVGSERSFSYRIPFALLRITSAGEYVVNFDYHPYQLSSWAMKSQITKEQMLRVWLGVERQSRIISIKSSESNEQIVQHERVNLNVR